MIENILTAVGVALTPIGAGIMGFIKLRDRLQTVETLHPAQHELVLVKLDAISAKIDLRCDILEGRVDRIERRVLNGDYHK